MASNHRRQESIVAVLTLTLLAILSGQAWGQVEISGDVPSGFKAGPNYGDGGGGWSITNNSGVFLFTGDVSPSSTYTFFTNPRINVNRPGATTGIRKVGMSGPVAEYVEGTGGSWQVFFVAFYVYQAGGSWIVTHTSGNGGGDAIIMVDDTWPHFFEADVGGLRSVEPASDGRGLPLWDKPYTVGLRINGSHGYGDYKHTVARYWVVVDGDGPDEDQTGQTPPGDGDDGDGKPPNKDPGDNPEDDPPDDEAPPSSDDPEEAPETGIQCIDELMDMFRSKFPTFTQQMTSGNDFWKVEFEIEIAGEKHKFFWSTKPDVSWGPGEALDKLRKWVRSFGILLMIVFALRQMVVALRQW